MDATRGGERAGRMGRMEVERERPGEKGEMAGEKMHI